MQSRGIHHVDLVVTDVDRSKEFYSALLRGLGWGGVLELQGERGETIWYLQAADTWLGLREKHSDAHPVPYDRYAVGVHHIAFEASTRDAVDQCWEWVLAQDVETESAPKEFPHYVAGLLRCLLLRSGWDQTRSCARADPRGDHVCLV